LSGEIIASLSAGLMVVGLDREVRILNPAGRRMLPEVDVPAGTHYGRPVREPALTAMIDECLAKGAPILRRSVRLAGVADGPLHLGVTVSPLFDEGRRVSGAICLFTDLTAVRQLEEQLRLKESLATVGEITAGIAHEFRNGLATIHGYSRL